MSLVLWLRNKLILIVVMAEPTLYFESILRIFLHTLCNTTIATFQRYAISTKKMKLRKLINKHILKLIASQSITRSRLDAKFPTVVQSKNMTIDWLRYIAMKNQY